MVGDAELFIAGRDDRVCIACVTSFVSFLQSVPVHQVGPSLRMYSVQRFGLGIVQWIRTVLGFAFLMARSSAIRFGSGAPEDGIISMSLQFL